MLEDPEGPPPDLRTVAVATREVLLAIAHDRPVLIAIDDSQWLDSPSITVVAHAIRRMQESPIGLLTTVRGTAPPPGDLESSVPRERSGHVLVGPLAPGAIHRLVVDRFGRGLPRPVLMRVFDQSGGNPFYALEIARALLSRERLARPDESLPIPDDLRGLLRMRLEGLGPETQQVLATVALMSDRSIAAIERSAPNSTDALAAAVAAEVLVVEGNRVRFSHPLLASAVTSQLLPHQVRSLHRRIASVVGDPEDRARHLALGADGPDLGVSAALDQAAAQAARRGALSTAAELGELAARLTPPTEGHTRRKRVLEAARRWMSSGEMNHARSIAGPLLQEDLGPRERAEVLVLLSEAQLDDIHASRAFAEEAAAVAREDPNPSPRTHVALAEAQMLHGDLRAAGVEARRALELAEAQGDRRQLVAALAFVTQVELWSASTTPGLLERALALEKPEMELQAYESPGFVLGWQLMSRGRLDEARDQFQDAHDRAAAAGDGLARSSSVLHLIELELRAGNWERASRLVMEDTEASEQLGMEFQGGSNLYVRALLAAHLGRVEEARTNAEAGIAASRSILDEIFLAQNESVLGFLELSLGDATAADKILRPLADRLEERGWLEPSVYRVLPNAIEALSLLGELTEARRLLARLEQRGRQAGSTWAEACAGRCCGLLRAADGDVPGAIGALEAALEAHDRLPDPFERARTLLALGICRRRAKRKAPARRSMQEALETFRGLGARLWVERAEAELRKISGRAPSPLDLTPTERQVAALVADGLSNREVADRLYVSVRTVEGHLSSMYRKLGVRSRTALVRELAASDPSRSEPERSPPSPLTKST